MSTFEYRSLSFHQAWPEPNLIELGAKLGFTDICFQTEQGTLGPLLDLRQRGREQGYFDLIDDLGLTTSLWVHELADYVSAWGDAEAGNQHLINGLERRYDYVLGDLFPDLDHLVLTTVESDVWVTDVDLLAELAMAIHRACDRTDTDLIVRTFTWSPEELDGVVAAIERLPTDIAVMTKYVPQDWHRRSIDHPLLGVFDDRTQFVEIDIAGEYYRMDHVCHAFTDDIAERVAYWQEQSLDGISVRVDRGWVPWQYRNSVLGEAQEANLWMLGRLAAGVNSDLDEIWREYTTHRFGHDAADAMTAALRPTGEVLAEGLCVGRETFGDTREAIPAARTLKNAEAQPYSDDEAEQATDEYPDPFHRNWSVWKWDPAFLEAYHRTRKGHQEVIEAKETAWAEAQRTASECLQALEAAEDDLHEGAYEFFRFKLEENAFHLDVMAHAILAWLRLSNRLYFADTRSDRRHQLELARDHLAALESLADRKDETTTCDWMGEKHTLTRGEYLDISGFVDRCREFWDLSGGGN